MTNTEAVLLVPAPLFSADVDARFLARALVDAAERGDGSPVFSPVLCFDDAEFLAEALSWSVFDVACIDWRSVPGVAGCCLAVSC